VGGARKLTSVSAISNNSESAITDASNISMAPEAVIWGERMGGSGEAGPTGALDSASLCGGVEATEGTVLVDLNSITCGDDQK